MEMTFTHVTVYYALSTKLIVLFDLLWPFIVAAWLPKRGKSAAPIAAALVPLALGAMDAWLGIQRSMWGMSVTGDGSHAVAAGLAEALFFVVSGACFAMAVLLFAAIRRHRPFVDRMTATLFAIVFASVVGAHYVAMQLSQRAPARPLLDAIYRSCVPAAIVAGIVAFLAILWTFLTGRGRRSSAPIPYGLPISAAAFVALVAITWTIVDSYREFAMGRG